MSELKLFKTEMTADNGTPVQLIYDREADILEVFFGENQPATGVELTDNIIIRVDQKTKRAISLMFIHFSILAEKTVYGPRSYPLDNLNNLPEDLRELVLHLIASIPVNQFLEISYFQASQTERIPFTFVKAQQSMAVI